VLPFPADNRQGVLGIVTGLGTAKAAEAGIAGIDPANGSLGSAAWADSRRLEDRLRAAAEVAARRTAARRTPMVPPLEADASVGSRV